MKSLILLLALLPPTPALAVSTPGGIPQVILGATPATPGGTGAISPGSLTGSGVNGMYQVSAGNVTGSLTSGRFYPFYKNGVAHQAGSSGTQCFSGVALFATTSAFQMVSDGSSFAYNAAALTTPTYQGGATSIYVYRIPASNLFNPIPGVYKFAANTFTGMQFDTTQAGVVSFTCFDQ